MKREHFAGPWGRGGRSEPPPADDAPAWLIGALPDDWFTERPEITIDRDEILIIGRLPEPALGEDASPAERASAEAGRIASWREATRDRRIGIARQAEHRYRRKVSWGARAGETDELFTTYSHALPRVISWADGEFPRAGEEAPAAHARAIKAKALDLLRGLLPASSLSHMGIFATTSAGN